MSYKSEGYSNPKKTKACQCCNKKAFSLCFDHDRNKWVCNSCWIKTHNINAIKSNWHALGISY